MSADVERNRHAGAENGGRRRVGRLAAAIAAVAAVALGSTGLASAGALPAPAQDVVHDVLAAVNLQVPEADTNRGACVSAVATGDLPKAEKAAAKAACPRGGPPGRREPGPPDESEAGRSGGAPGRSGAAPGRAGVVPGQAKHADDPCRGRPPWAGDHSIGEEEKAAMQAERAACPDDDAVSGSDGGG